ESGKRPICPVISDFDTEIGLDDVVAQTIMPYGLAASLLVDENPSTADFFQQRYEELILKLGGGIPSGFEPIEDIYGIADLSEFSKW
ncbi:MAG: hypothetical protein GX103_07075, partial [Bacteroidales bacterium]|nr:hypothetical protein [Bacteroidales bacterium]